MNVLTDIEEAKIWIEDEIVHVVFYPNTILTLDLAKAVVKQRLEVSNGKDFRIYVDIRGILSVDEQTRKYLAGRDGTQNAIAAAIHVGNPLSKFLANLFIKVDRPDKPLKLFTDKTKAMNWLKKIGR